MSRLKHASLTRELSDFRAAAEVDRDLLEWNYRNYEERTSVDIHAERRDRLLFRGGCAEGEILTAVAARVERVVSRARVVPGDALMFSSGYFRSPYGTHF